MEIRSLSKDNITKISSFKKENANILDYRLKAYEAFKKLPLPNFGPELKLDFDDVLYYKASDETMKDDWGEIKTEIKCVFDDLGVVKSEQYLNGLGVQYESEVIYHNMLDELKSKKVIFTSIEDALKNHWDLVEPYFGKIVDMSENKFTALNSAVFSGGSFIYVPKHTHLDRPLQSYFRINSERLGQFERTLIIVDDDSSLHYMEGCTAKAYTKSNLHAAVVEIYVGKNSSCRYTTIQNWSNNVYNLVTKRALVSAGGTMEWVDGNIGSYKNMKYPCCILKGEGASGKCITIGVAKDGQYQDTGAKMIHLAKNTKSTIISKSIASSLGRADFRSKVYISKEASNSEALVKCDTLLLDKDGVSYAYPTNICENSSSFIEHEATVARVSEEKLFYLMCRGLSYEEAMLLIILGFTSSFKEELPMEYAVELNQLLKSIL